MRRSFRPAPLAVAFAVAACGTSYSPDTYSTAAVQQAAKVEQGVVAGVRPVKVQASGSTGAVAGAAAGGVLGAAAPTAGIGNALTTIGGSLVGGLVGTGVERVAGDTTAFEYIVRKGNGELVSVTQKDAQALPLGQRVLVIAGPQARIVPDYTVASDPVPPAAAAPGATTSAATNSGAGAAADGTAAKPEPPPAPSFTTIQ